MKVTGVEASLHRISPASPWEDATNRVQAIELVIVRITTDSRHEGVGITYSVDVGGTSIQALITDYLGGLVIGEDPLDHERIWERLHRQSRRLGAGVNSMAIAGIDVAVWDLMGKYYGVPLYRLLGGSRDSVKAYISEIKLSQSDTVEALCERIESYRARGFDHVKIKIGYDDFERDLERLRAATAMLPPRSLFVDLNQKWLLSEAVSRAADLDSLRLGWVEEPLVHHDVAAHASLRRQLRTPLALGESLHSRNQVLQFLTAGAVDYVQADVAFIGGITEWRRVAATAASFNKPVAPHYMMELSLQLLCGVPNAFMLEDVVGGSFSELGLLAEPIAVSNGVAAPPDRPGHGIVFDQAALERCRVEPASVRSSFSGGSK